MRIVAGDQYGARMLDWRATRDFIAVYDQLDNELAGHVDDIIRQLVRDPHSAWARQGRVVGTHRSAWIVESRLDDALIALYWTFDSSGSLVILVLLVVR